MSVVTKNHKKLSSNLFHLVICILLLGLFQQNIEAAETCRIENYAFEIPCGIVQTSVLSNDSKKSKHFFELRYYQVPAKVRYPKPEPILWIPDGIAQYNTDRAPAMISTLSRMRNARDFLWLESRSTGLSAIGCQDTQVLQLTETLQRYRNPDWLNDCKRKLDRFGGEKVLSYEQIAADYERLLIQLDVKKVILVVEGRGYEVYRAWLKHSPHRFKAVIIDSPIMMDTQSIQRRNQHIASRYASIVARCRLSSACQQKYALEDNPIQVLSQHLPQEIRVVDPLSGHMSTTNLDEEILVSLFSIAMSQPSRSAMIIKAIDQAKQGQWQLFFNLAGLSNSRRLSTFEHGSNIVEQCHAYPLSANVGQEHEHSTGLFTSLSKIETKKLIKLCHRMGLNPANKPDQAQSKVNSQNPTLVLRGALNKATSFDETVHNRLKQVIVPNSESPILGYGCARDVLYYFIKQIDDGKPFGSIDLDVSCLQSIQPYPLPAYELGLTPRP